MNNMQNVYNYYYRFKQAYIKKIKEEYNSSDDKIYYENIKDNDGEYSSFVKKILFLFYNSTTDTKKIIEVRELLESRYLLDRLKGLKDFKYSLNSSKDTSKDNLGSF